MQEAFLVLFHWLLPYMQVLQFFQLQFWHHRLLTCLALLQEQLLELLSSNKNSYSKELIIFEVNFYVLSFTILTNNLYKLPFYNINKEWISLYLSIRLYLNCLSFMITYIIYYEILIIKYKLPRKGCILICRCSKVRVQRNRQN